MSIEEISPSNNPPDGVSRRGFLAAAAGVAAAGRLGSTLIAAAEPPLTPGTAPRAAEKPDEIWDLHGHLASVPGGTPEERAERLVEHADRMGVSRFSVCMGMTFSFDPSPDELRTANDEVLRAVARYPKRIFGFVYLSPRHVRQSLAELERCVRDGPMVGVKLWVAMHADAPELDPLIARATELRAVILQHTWIKITGNLAGESTPMQLAALAARHPEARLVCGHAGGDWEKGIRAVRAHKNICVDLGGGDPVAGMTEMAVRELGPERVIYGSDVPGRSFASQLAKVYGADLPDDARRLILAGNLKRLLGPILASKGVGP